MLPKRKITIFLLFDKTSLKGASERCVSVSMCTGLKINRITRYIIASAKVKYPIKYNALLQPTTFAHITKGAFATMPPL